MSAPARRVPLSMLLACTACTWLGAQQSLPADRTQGASTVNLEQIRTWIYKLASPEFEGRGTGQPGFKKAAEYVRDHFVSLGLEPGGDDGTFFQGVPWTSARVDAAKTSVTFRKGKQTVLVPADRLGGFATKTLHAKGNVVLVTTADPDAIEKLDLKDRIVLFQAASGGRGRSGPLGALQGKGAAAVLTVQKEPVQGRLAGMSGVGRGGGNRAAQGMRLAPANVSFGGEDLTAVLGLAGADPGPGDAPMRDLALEAEVQITVEETELPACNVVAKLPGADAQRRAEYVVIGSHLDHLGKRNGTLYPGADDDGSGTTGVMAIATMLAKNPTRPARSVMFVCFCGEENGLIGSRFFADHPPIPLAAIVGELQMDMIGRDEEESREDRGSGEKAEDNKNSLHLVGSKKLSPDLHALCLQKNETAKFDLEWDQEGMFGRSDHANFARMGVPIAFFFTGLHRDYHEPTDTPDKINLPKLLRVATYVYDIAFELAQQEPRPLIDPALWENYRNRGSEIPAAPLRPAKND